MTTETTVHLPSVKKHKEHLEKGFAYWPSLDNGLPPAMGDARWPAELILATWHQATTGRPPENGLEYRTGKSGGGFDRLGFKFLAEDGWTPETENINLAIPLNRRGFGKEIEIAVPWYGGGMSFGSVSEHAQAIHQDPLNLQ